jgi:hypothetical protein
MRVGGFLCGLRFIKPPFSGVGTAGGDDAKGSVAESESHDEKQAVHLSKGKAALLSIITPGIFQDKPGVSQNLRGVAEIDAMLGQIAPTLGLVPFEFHIHSNSIL